MDWSDTITDVGRPINFKVPYFHDYARFNWGDMILIGAKTKYGKTSLSMNFVKRLVDQGIKPRYLYTESGGRFQKSALQLGMKDKDFWRCYVDDVEEIQIPKGEVVVWDWIDPPNFAETNVLFGKIVKKIEKAQAFLIGFVQLKDDKDSSWFAPNMIRQRPCLACKYLYEDEDDGKNTYFHITEVREPKMRGKSYKIPCTYKWETNEVIRIDELKKDIKKELKS